MEKKTIYIAVAALVGLVWMFRKGNATPTTIPGYTGGPSNTPATTGATGQNPLIIVTTKPGETGATADLIASNPMPPPVVPTMGFTVGGVTTGGTTPEWTPTPTNTVTADSQFSSQADYNEYQRRVQGLGW